MPPALPTAVAEEQTIPARLPLKSQATARRSGFADRSTPVLLVVMGEASEHRYGGRFH
jgi:hypothetical protein